MPKGKNMLAFARKAGISESDISRQLQSAELTCPWEALEAAVGIERTGGSSGQDVDMYLDEDAIAQNKLPLFTAEDVRKHRRRDDLWIIVKGFVYDVTTYLPV